MINFYNEFTSLENLDYLNRNDNNYLQVLYIIYLLVINEKLEEMKSYFNNYPIRSAGGKTLKQMHTLGSSRLQVINTSISL